MAAMNPGFRQDIQGLRALAVLLVILDHARIGPFHGGFIGVDVFFVISGFLITGLLVSEAERTGRASLLGFYARRARRILPAATLVILATVVASIYFLSAVEANGAIEDALWATFFAANFKFARDGTDYFQNDTPPSPLQHYWSLGGGGAVLPRLAAAGAAALPVRRVAGPAQRRRPEPRPAGPRPRRLAAGRHRRRLVRLLGVLQHDRPGLGVLLAVHPGLGAGHRRARRVPEHPADPAQAGGAGAAVVGRAGRGGGRGARLRRHHGLPGVRRRAAGGRHRRVAGRRPARRLLGTAVAAVGAADAGGGRLVLLALPLALAGADHRQPGVAAGRGLAGRAGDGSRGAPLGGDLLLRGEPVPDARRSSGCAGCAGSCSTPRSSS